MHKLQLYKSKSSKTKLADLHYIAVMMGTLHSPSSKKSDNLQII